MSIDLAVLSALVLLLTWDAHQQELTRLRSLLAAFWLAAPLLILELQEHAPGSALVIALGYILGSRLSVIAEESPGVAELSAGLAAGGLAATGPLGVVCASSAIAIHAVLLRRTTPASAIAGRLYLVSALLLFVPLVVLTAVAVSALIETGDPLAIGAGGDVFLRGPLWRAEMHEALYLLPALLPLGLSVWASLRTRLMAPLALIAASLIASVFFATPAPLLPLTLAALLSTGTALLPERGAQTGRFIGLALVPALMAGALIAHPGSARSDRPFVAPWRVTPGAADALPAWGVSDAAAQAHPDRPPRFTHRDGQYVLEPD